MDIRNVYCVGRNYRLHAAELGNEVPSAPMLFMKPSHAAVSVEQGTLLIPGGQGPVHYETELVFRVGRSYRPGITPDELFSHLTVGLDLTLRGVQEGLKAKGLPWLPAKGFRNSAPLGRWLELSGSLNLAQQDFGLRMNGQEVQRGHLRDMVFDVEELAHFVGQTYGMAEGDLLFTGTPAGVGSLSEADELEWWLGQEVLGRARVVTEG
jgi:fumarylpyruvate hydrolase